MQSSVTCEQYDNRALIESYSKVQSVTFRALLLLLYGTGLRISEALSLTLADVDLSQSLLTIHNTKFFKTRWVPIGPQLSVHSAPCISYVTAARIKNFKTQQLSMSPPHNCGLHITHWAPTSGNDAQAPIRIGVVDSRQREPALRKYSHPLPRDATFLTSTP